MLFCQLVRLTLAAHAVGVTNRLATWTDNQNLASLSVLLTFKVVRRKVSCRIS